MFENPVLGPRIVPFGAARQATDVLPNGHPSFRVTQRFADLDAFFRDRVHGALDLGNFGFAGELAKAMAGGTVTLLRDPNGALGVSIRHPNGYTSQLWHLSDFAVANGARVSTGTTVGHVGNTGLDIGGRHLHVAVLRPGDGLPVDPWPLLYQNITQYRVLKGAGINVRNRPVDGVIFASSFPKGIIRTDTGNVIAPLNHKMRYGGTVKGADGMPWDRVYLQSRYRTVRSDLLLKG